MEADSGGLHWPPRHAQLSASSAAMSPGRQHDYYPREAPTLGHTLVRQIGARSAQALLEAAANEQQQQQLGDLDYNYSGIPIDNQTARVVSANGEGGAPVSTWALLVRKLFFKQANSSSLISRVASGALDGLLSSPNGTLALINDDNDSAGNSSAAIIINNLINNNSLNSSSNAAGPDPNYGQFSVNWPKLLLAIFFVLIMLSTAIGNLFVIFAILLERNLRTVGNYLVLSLAIADLLVACLVMPLASIYKVLDTWTLGIGLCDVWTSADVFCCTASILHLLAIALDRYWAVTRVNYIRCQRNEKRILYMILLVWTVALITSLAPVFGWKDAEYESRIINQNQCLVSQDIFYQIFATCITFYFPLMLTLIFYWKIYQVARKRIRRKPGNRIKISLQHPSSSSSQSSPYLVQSSQSTSVGTPGGCATRSPSLVSHKQLAKCPARAHAAKHNHVQCPPRNSVKSALSKFSPLKKQYKTTSVTLASSQSFSPTTSVEVQEPEREEARPSDGATGEIKKSSSSSPVCQCFCHSPQASPARRIKIISCEAEKSEPNDEAKRNDICNGQSKEGERVDLADILSFKLSGSERTCSCSCASSLNPLALNSYSNNSNLNSISTTTTATATTINKQPDRTRTKNSGHKDNDKDSDHREHRCSKHADEEGRGEGGEGDDDDDDDEEEEEEDEEEDDDDEDDEEEASESQGSHLAALAAKNGADCLVIAASTTNIAVSTGVRPYVLNQTNSVHNNHANNNVSQDGHAAANQQPSNQMESRRERKAAKTLAIITGVFVMCWLPFFVMALLMALLRFEPHEGVFDTFLWLGYINSMLNPIIYTIFSPDFRKAFKRLIGIDDQSVLKRRRKRQRKLEFSGNSSHNNNNNNNSNNRNKSIKNNKSASQMNNSTATTTSGSDSIIAMAVEPKKGARVVSSAREACRRLAQSSHFKLLSLQTLMQPNSAGSQPASPGQSSSRPFITPVKAPGRAEPAPVQV